MDLGERTLKDLDRPVRLFELAAPGLQAPDAPATAQPGDGAAAAPAGRHNLPAPLTSFLGRDQDLARLEGLLGRGTAGHADRAWWDGEDPAGGGGRDAGGGPVPGRGVAG